MCRGKSIPLWSILKSSFFSRELIKHAAYHNISLRGKGAQNTWYRFSRCTHLSKLRRIFYKLLKQNLLIVAMYILHCAPELGKQSPLRVGYTLSPCHLVQMELQVMIGPSCSFCRCFTVRPRALNTLSVVLSPRIHVVFTVIDGEMMKSFIIESIVPRPLVGDDDAPFLNMLYYQICKSCCRTVLHFKESNIFIITIHSNHPRSGSSSSIVSLWRSPWDCKYRRAVSSSWMRRYSSRVRIVQWVPWNRNEVHLRIAWASYQFLNAVHRFLLPEKYST